MYSAKTVRWFLTVVLGSLTSVGCGTGETDSASADRGGVQVSGGSSAQTGPGDPATTALVDTVSPAEAKEAAERPAIPDELPTLADVAEVINFVEFKPSDASTTVFLGNGGLSYSTTEDAERVTRRIHEQLAARGFRAGAANETAMETLTFKKDDRPATIMISRGKDPSVAIVEMYFWGGVDLSALTDLPQAVGVSRTTTSLRYAVPLSLSATRDAMRTQLSDLGWPLARTSQTRGTATQFEKDGLRFTCHVSRMENQEFESPGASQTGSTNVHLVAGPHFDVTQLPTPRLAERLFESSFSAGQSTKYLATGKPKKVMSQCVDQLQQAGWKPVRAIRPGIGELHGVLVKHGCTLQVQISAVEGDRSEVSYYASMLPFDLPKGIDLRTVRVDSASPHLSFVTDSSDLVSLTEFYVRHLKSTGWKLDDERQHDSSGKNMRVFHGTHYQPVLMEVQRQGDETWVELRPVANEEIVARWSTAESAPANSVADVAATSTPAAQTLDEEVTIPEFGEAELAKQLEGALELATQELKNSGVDDADTTRMLEALKAQAAALSAAGGGDADGPSFDPAALSSALEGIVGEEEPAEEEPVAAEIVEVDETHGVRADTFPVPDDAVDVKRQSDIESISYYTTKVRPHADFFAKELKKLGFRPRGESEVDDEFGFMQFQKGNGSIRISLIPDDRRKPPVRVMILGDGLLWPNQSEFDRGDFVASDQEPFLDAEGEPFDETDGSAGDEFATPTEHEGIPLPEKLDSFATTGTPFRQEVMATKQGKLSVMVDFFRQRLTSKGWAEEPSSKVEDTKAHLVFKQKANVLTAKLEQFGDEVDLQIEKRDVQQAKAAGMLPPDGKARVILANASPGKAKISLAGKTHELAAGVGAEDPADGIKVDLPPGTHAVAVEAAGEKQQGEIKLEAGGTWGVIALPNGGYYDDRVY